MKKYLEKRYNHDGKLRVFSAGTFTTEKIRSVIKDVCSIHKVSRATANYITAIIDDKSDWTDLMKLAFENKKVVVIGLEELKSDCLTINAISVKH